MPDDINGGRSPPGLKRIRRPAGNGTANLKIATVSNSAFLYGEETKPQQDAIWELRRQRHIENLHRCGPRALAECIAEIERGADVGRTLAKYGEANHELIRAVGGDKFPTWPLWAVGDLR